jgi:2-oxoisovalerate dehydrogenase E2 component (dihydrolipoyl transacylase)
MAVAPIKMPQLGESVTEGTIDRWLKREGDQVKQDEPIVAVVTDKVNAEIPSPFEGRLVRIVVAEGRTVPIGVEIAQMEVAEGAAAPEVAETPSVEAPGAPEPAAEALAAPPPPGSPGAERPKLSPAVRRLSQEHGIDPGQVTGTGEGGRVTYDDLLAYIAIRREAALAPEHAAPSAPEPAPAALRPSGERREERVTITAVRRQIAEHMVRSLATAPHAWGMIEVDVTELVRYRETEKAGFVQRNGVQLTYLPLIMQVLTDALQVNPYLNATWTEEAIVLKRYFNIGVAVAAPSGLIVPVVHDADQLGLVDLTRAINDVVERARNRQLRPTDVQGGTFTLNNTGALGTTAGMPIIHQPQSAIMTTEAIQRRPAVVGDGIAIRHLMNVCVSIDHRVIDGEQSAQFLVYMKNRLESWTPAIIRL